MSIGSISHRTRSQEVMIATSDTASSGVICSDMAAGMVHIAGASSTATLSVYASPDGNDYVALFNADGSPATITIPAAGVSAMPLPDAVYPLQYVKLVSDTDLGTAVTCSISLKS